MTQKLGKTIKFSAFLLVLVFLTGIVAIMIISQLPDGSDTYEDSPRHLEYNPVYSEISEFLEITKDQPGIPEDAMVLIQNIENASLNQSGGQIQEISEYFSRLVQILSQEETNEGILARAASIEQEIRELESKYH